MTTLAGNGATTSDATFELPLERLHQPEDNVRADVGDVSELAKSIEQMGIIEPIVVMPRWPAGEAATDDTGGYLVVCGSRRVAAAAIAGLTHVPAIVREFTDEERVEVMIVENLQRQDLTALEEGRAFKRLAELPMSQRAIAERLGVSQGHVSKRLALIALPQVAHDALDSGGITVEQAIELAKIDSAKIVTKTVKEALKYPGSASHTISNAVREATNLRKRDTKIAELQAEGKTAVAMPNGWQAPKGHERVREHRYGDDVQMQPSKHRKLACHVTGVTVGYNGDVDLVDLCSDPSKHPQPKTPTAAAASGGGGVSKKHLAHRQALEEAAERRIEFLRQLCAKPLPKGDLLEIATLALVTNADWIGEYETAAAILELDKEDEDHVVTSTTIGDFAGESPAHLARAAAAYALDILSEQLHGYYGRNGWEEPGGPLFAFLERKGYEISPAERLELDGKAPR